MSTLPPQSNLSDPDVAPAPQVEVDAVADPEPAVDDMEGTDRLPAAIVIALALALLLCVALILIAYRGR